METYQSIVQGIESIRKPILITGILGCLAQVLIVGVGMYLQRDLRDKLNSLETCYQGMHQLFNNAPSEDFFSGSVLKDVKNISFMSNSLRLVKVINNYECDVVVKDSKGHRSYRVKLEKNLKFPHLYRISDVRGQKLVSKYQWKEEL